MHVERIFPNQGCRERPAADPGGMKGTRYWMSTGLPTVLAVGGNTRPEFASERGGLTALEHVCRSFGYKVDAYPVRNLHELRRTIRFIGAVGRLPEFEADPILLHVSANGDGDGMGIGPDRMTWDQLAPMILDTVRDLKACPRPVTLALSAPGANEPQLASLLSQPRAPARLPDHTFLFVDRPPRRTDAIFAWSHFYGEAREMDFTSDSVADQPNTQRLRIRMRRLGMGRFRYFHGKSASVEREREPFARENPKAQAAVHLHR